MPSWQPPGQASPQYGDPEEEQEMGKKIQYIGRYVMDARTLGKGNFARVELATHGVTQIKVAIKVIDTRKIKEDYVRQNLHREARIMAQLRHPNIIRLYETLKATTLYCLVMEYASGGELLTYIKEQKDSRLGESLARPYFRQLLSALQYLHERGVVHRDLKMENILLDEKKKNIKLVDFGLSNVYSADQPLKTHCGSPEYAAPELFQTGRTYGPEIDIWSLGIITYAMIIGRLPFVMHMTDNYHRQKLLQAIQKGLSKQHEREMQHLTSECRSLIQHLIEPTPGLRYKLPDIMTHTWVTKHGKMPFAPFQPPLKDKHLRSQIVVELAELMQMEKKAVSESVKENRADELSSMFNMLIDEKKRHKGLFDIDHTLKRVEAKTITPKMRALGAKGKTDQPNLVKRSAANKLNVPKEVHMMPPTVQEIPADQPDSSSKPPQASLRPESALCDPSKRPTTQNTTTGPSTRIPKRQQTPTHKLNLTLDLSVVNVPASSRTDLQRRCQGAHSSGSSLSRSRVQSPSKIPLPSPIIDSQCSPNDDSGHSSRRKRGTCLPLPRPSRPTSLNFRGNKAIPMTKPPLFQGKGVPAVCEAPLVAPKATPEDTAVTSSASDTNLDSMQCDMLNASDDEKLEKLEQLKYALLGGCIPRQSTSDMVCDEPSRSSGTASDTQVAERTHKPLARQLATVRNANTADAKPCWYPPSKEGTSQRQCENTSGDTLNDSQTDNTLIITPKAKDRSNSNAQYSEVKTAEVSKNTPPLKRGQSENANSGLPHYKDCVVHVCRNKSPPRYSECVEPTVVETHGLEANSDIIDVSNTPEGMSSGEANSNSASPKTAIRCTTCGSHLPQRPHKLFTSGAHALDMFVSPEDISPTMWESEGGATTERGSPMQAAPLLRDSPSQLRNNTPSQLPSHLPNVANKPLMQVSTPPKNSPTSYSDGTLTDEISSPKKAPGNKSNKEKVKTPSPKKTPGNRWSLPPQSPTKQGNSKLGQLRSNTLSGIRYRFSSSADRSKQMQRNNVYTNVPDKSMRLEPVGAESETAHAEPPTGNHVTVTHNNSNHGNVHVKNGKRAPSLSSQPCRALSCDSTSNSQKSTPSNSSHIVGRELSPPHSPQKSNATPKWLVMKKYDQQRKGTSWRQGLSHLLRRAKPNGAPSPKETEENKPNIAANRRSRPKTREVYYKQLEAKWTAPASPAHTHSTHNSMEVTSSPVPSTSPSPQQQYFDITTTTHSESPSLRRIKSSPCKDCSKMEKAMLEQSNDEILGLDTKLKLECSIDSAIHKSLTLSNSLSSRLPMRHHKVAQQGTPNSNPATKRNS